jgi:hypothetical protein
VSEGGEARKCLDALPCRRLGNEVIAAPVKLAQCAEVVFIGEGEQIDGRATRDRRAKRMLRYQRRPWPRIQIDADLARLGVCSKRVRGGAQLHHERFVAQPDRAGKDIDGDERTFERSTFEQRPDRSHELGCEPPSRHLANQPPQIGRRRLDEPGVPWSIGWIELGVRNRVCDCEQS